MSEYESLTLVLGVLALALQVVSLLRQRRDK